MISLERKNERNVTKIQVQSPRVRNLDMGSMRNLELAPTYNDSRKQNRALKPRHESKQQIGELQKIKEKLNRSALNRFFSQDSQK